jgi:DNA-binding response OmpR family regulator
VANTTVGEEIHVGARFAADAVRTPVDASLPDWCAPHSVSIARRSILVVDDDRSARTALAAILRGQSFAVSEAGAVAEAVSMLADAPDWILLDLMLPDGSGCRVLRQAAAQGTTSRICVITGAGHLMIAEAQKLGARHVLRKPLDLGRLLSILQT